MFPKFNKNEEREKEKGGERKQRNFSNTVTEIPLPKMLPVQLKKKQLRQHHCQKRKKKKFVLAIVAIPLPKLYQHLGWRCVYPCFCHGIINSLGSARVMKVSCYLSYVDSSLLKDSCRRKDL